MKKEKKPRCKEELQIMEQRTSKSLGQRLKVYSDYYSKPHTFGFGVSFVSGVENNLVSNKSNI